MAGPYQPRARSDGRRPDRGPAAGRPRSLDAATRAAVRHPAVPGAGPPSTSPASPAPPSRQYTAPPPAAPQYPRRRSTPPPQYGAPAPQYPPHRSTAAGRSRRPGARRGPRPSSRRLPGPVPGAAVTPGQRPASPAGGPFSAPTPYQRRRRPSTVRRRHEGGPDRRRDRGRDRHRRSSGSRRTSATRRLRSDGTCHQPTRRRRQRRSTRRRPRPTRGRGRHRRCPPRPRCPASPRTQVAADLKQAKTGHGRGPARPHDAHRSRPVDAARAARAGRPRPDIQKALRRQATSSGSPPSSRPARRSPRAIDPGQGHHHGQAATTVGRHQGARRGDQLRLGLPVRRHRSGRRRPPGHHPRRDHLGVPRAVRGRTWPRRAACTSSIEDYYAYNMDCTLINDSLLGARQAGALRHRGGRRRRQARSTRAPARSGRHR